MSSQEKILDGCPNTQVSHMFFQTVSPLIGKDMPSLFT
jgi:hypothetical protein